MVPPARDALTYGTRQNRAGSQQPWDNGTRRLPVQVGSLAGHRPTSGAIFARRGSAAVDSYGDSNRAGRRRSTATNARNQPQVKHGDARRRAKRIELGVGGSEETAGE
jgi:hypothetical protein